MAETEKSKRKTHTSSAVKNRYNSRVYSTVAAALPKEMVARFKQKCAERGISQTEIIRQAVENFLAE